MRPPAEGMQCASGISLFWPGTRPRSPEPCMANTCLCVPGCLKGACTTQQCLASCRLQENLFSSSVGIRDEQKFIKLKRSKAELRIHLCGQHRGGMRMCVVFRMLNKQTIRNNFPLPCIDDLLDSRKPPLQLP